MAEQAPSTINPNLERIESALSLGLGIHDLRDERYFPGDVKVLAEQAGIHTTTTAERPGDDFNRRLKTAEQIGRLATQHSEALEGDEEFSAAKAENKLGTTVSDLLDVSLEEGLTIENLHIAKYKPKTWWRRRSSGVLTYGKITFNVHDAEQQSALASFFYSSLQTDARKNPFNIRPNHDRETGRYSVSVTNMTEHTIRVLEQSLAGITAEEDKITTNTTLPVDDLPLSHLKESNHTFHPDVEGRMEKINARYQSIKDKLTAGKVKVEIPGWSQKETDRLLQEELTKKPEALAKSPSAALEFLRKVANVKTRPMRKDGSRNTIQASNKKDRLRIEEGVELRRDVVASKGRPRARAMKASESVGDRAKTAAGESRGNAYDAAAKAIFDFTGGLAKAAEVVVRGGVPSVWRGAKVLHARHKARTRQDQEHLEGKKKIAKFVTEQKEAQERARLE